MWKPTMQVDHFPNGTVDQFLNGKPFRFFHIYVGLPQGNPLHSTCRSHGEGWPPDLQGGREALRPAPAVLSSGRLRAAAGASVGR